jgi:hypothetical protein
MRRVMLERQRDYKRELVDLGCKPDDIGTVTWNSVTRSVDVSGSVDLRGMRLTRLPFQFGKVGGYFVCTDNRLTSLDGCPEKVGSSFSCSFNRLTSLEGCPREVGGHFYCSRNRLTSLDWAPEKVGSRFSCSVNDLVDVSALRQCKINGEICLYGSDADKARVTTMLKTQGFKGEIR